MLEDITPEEIQLILLYRIYQQWRNEKSKKMDQLHVWEDGSGELYRYEVIMGWPDNHDICSFDTFEGGAQAIKKLLEESKDD